MKPLPPVNLQESAERVTHHAATITKIEQDAQRKTLLPRLLIGLHCLKAHTMFALVDASKRKGIGGRGKKKQPAQEELTTSSYKTWLYTADHTLKEPNTYRYMSAVRGLGCDETTTEEELTTVFKTYTNPTLALLCNAATEPVQPTDPPQQQEQLEFDLLRSCLKSTRQQCEELVATADRIREYPDLHKAAVARLYKTLQTLTGTHWAPSDEEHEYAHIDPDQIQL
jgi:hypothetical protein